ncbi:MAG: hypothetical protein ACODTU_18780 [Pigmentiphaga sp.]|uniref:hypothetical protein n=1 Tax=Pigmentiphaga sp. TaxID=1977564 RepID=UPI003B564583
MKPVLILQAARLAACVSLACAASIVHAQQTYKVAIAQFGPDHTLDTLVSSFKKELARQGLKVVYDEGHVNFDRSLAPQLLNREAAGKPDLMLTITTPLTQTAKQVLASRSFPIVFGAVANHRISAGHPPRRPGPPAQAAMRSQASAQLRQSAAHWSMPSRPSQLSAHCRQIEAQSAHTWRCCGTPINMK